MALLPALQNEPYTGRKETKGLARAVGACTVLRLHTAGAMMFRQAAGACIVLRTQLVRVQCYVHSVAYTAGAYSLVYTAGACSVVYTAE